jgi:hypothetical protein
MTDPGYHTNGYPWSAVGQPKEAYWATVNPEQYLADAGLPPHGVTATFRYGRETFKARTWGGKSAQAMLDINVPVGTKNVIFTADNVSLPAGFAVETFLEGLDRLNPVTHISASEIRARKQTSADFGFDAPPVVISLERGDQRRELRFGARTPAGDQVYVEVVGQPGYAEVGSEILERLPRTQHDWRDTGLFHLGGEPIDRFEVTRPGAGFVLELDATNRLWRLTRTGHRALAAEKPELDIRILCWKATLAISASQNFFTLKDRFGFAGTNVKMKLDGKLPFGASHHQKMIIIDDVLATGGTLAAATHLVRGFEATLVGAAVVIELGFLGGREKLGENVTLHSVLKY